MNRVGNPVDSELVGYPTNDVSSSLRIKILSYLRVIEDASTIASDHHIVLFGDLRSAVFVSMSSEEQDSLEGFKGKVGTRVGRGKEDEELSDKLHGLDSQSCNQEESCAKAAQQHGNGGGE